MKKVIVIKIGGKVFEQDGVLNSLLGSIILFKEEGYQVCLVHGGGKRLDEMQEKLQIPIKKINGRRITDKATLEVAQMVYKGLINTELTAHCRKLGIQVIGISGADADLITAVKRPVKMVFNRKTQIYESVDFGFVGDILKVNTQILEYLLGKGYLPVIACLGVDTHGQILNINADTLAAKLALQLQVEKLIFVTDTAGVLAEKNAKKTLPVLNLIDLDLLLQNKIISDGMIAKTEQAKAAVEGGIKQVQIVGGLTKSKEWVEAVLNKKYGTILNGGKEKISII